MSDAIQIPGEPSRALVPQPPATLEVAAPRLRPGDRIERFGVIYEYKAKVPGGKKFTRLDTGADDIVVTNMVLLQEMEQRIIKLAAPTWLNDARKSQWHLTFEARSQTEKRMAWMRLAYVQALEENRKLGYPLKVGQVVDRTHRVRMADPANVYAGEEKPCVSAVYKWLAIWDNAKLKSIKVLCFAESKRGPREPQLSDEVKPLLKDAIRELWFTPERKRIRVIYDRFYTLAAAQQVPPTEIPCERTVRRIIKKLPPYAVAKARHGVRVADHKYRSVGQMVEAALPGEVYELDAHRLNWVAVDRKGWPIGRLWVTVVLDRCTRCVVGQHVHVEPPSSLTVAAALRNAFAPKLYMLRRWPEIGRAWPCWGKPTLIILDNALENKATFLTEALMELGIAWHWAAARKPEEKPYVERYFGTMDSDLATRIPGWTGANPQEKGDYDSVQMSCLTEEDSDEIIHRWVVAYNIDTHTFNGMKVVPEQNWREATDLEVTPIEDLGMLDVLLGDYAVRRARRTGIELLGLRYGDKGDYRPIEAIRTRAGAGDFIDVRIRFDRSDLSHIHVQDPQTKEYIPVPSLDSKYTEGLTLARHRIIRRKAAERAKGYISIGELCAVRDDLQNRIDAMTGAEPMTERRYAAIFNGLGSKGSWAEFYRLSNEEYGRSRKDARPVVDLLEEDFEWTPGAAEAAPKEAPGAAGPAANEGAGTHEPAAPAEEPAAPGKDAAAPTAPDPAASPKPKGDLAARMKLLGME